MGRFQDADAAAYYEYHCSLHGEQVVHVSESFANDNAPTTVLLKSIRRVMAAEYSRDIATKSRAGQQRVVSMGLVSLTIAGTGEPPKLSPVTGEPEYNGQTRILLDGGAADDCDPRRRRERGAEARTQVGRLIGSPKLL